jgi:hypothetical protein
VVVTTVDDQAEEYLIAAEDDLLDRRLLFQVGFAYHA